MRLARAVAFSDVAFSLVPLLLRSQKNAKPMMMYPGMKYKSKVKSHASTMQMPMPMHSKFQQ
jgi:hypothetical protein